MPYKFAIKDLRAEVNKFRSQLQDLTSNSGEVYPVNIYKYKEIHRKALAYEDSIVFLKRLQLERTK